MCCLELLWGAALNPISGFVSVVLFDLIFAVTTRGTRPLFSVMGPGGQLVSLTFRGMFTYVNLNLSLSLLFSVSQQKDYEKEE